MQFKRIEWHSINYSYNSVDLESINMTNVLIIDDLVSHISDLQLNNAGSYYTIPYARTPRYPGAFIQTNDVELKEAQK